ncbi:unnamed protein product [Sympodiomycopsis kandeliae]
MQSVLEEPLGIDVAAGPRATATTTTHTQSNGRMSSQPPLSSCESLPGVPVPMTVGLGDPSLCMTTTANGNGTTTATCNGSCTSNKQSRTNTGTGTATTTAAMTTISVGERLDNQLISAVNGNHHRTPSCATSTGTTPTPLQVQLPPSSSSSRRNRIPPSSPHIIIFNNNNNTTYKMAAELPRILIPGGAGYIGSHVVLSVLLTRRYRVVVVDNFHNSFPTAIERVQEIATSSLPADATTAQKNACKVEVVKGDLRNRDTFANIFAQNTGADQIYAVILVAALKAVGESGEIPIDYYDVNISGLVNLLRAMKDHKINRLVYSSSATVYGTPKQIPIPETSPLQAESVYGRTKQMGEIIIKDVCDAYPEFRAISLRYFNPAGAHPSGLIGEDPRGKPGNLLPLLAQMAVGKYREPGLKVFGNDYPTPDGTCVRDYLHVMDLADGHINALDAIENDARFSNLPAGSGKYRAFNLGNGKGQSVLEMIEAMKKVSGYAYPFEIQGRRKGDVPDLTADPTLAEKEIGFKTKYGLEEMARDLWNWQSKNPQGYGQQ